MRNSCLMRKIRSWRLARSRHRLSPKKKERLILISATRKRWRNVFRVRKGELSPSFSGRSPRTVHMCGKPTLLCITPTATVLFTVRVLHRSRRTDSPFAERLESVGDLYFSKYFFERLRHSRFLWMPFLSCPVSSGTYSLRRLTAKISDWPLTKSLDCGMIFKERNAAQTEQQTIAFKLRKNSEI